MDKAPRATFLAVCIALVTACSSQSPTGGPPVPGSSNGNGSAPPSTVGGGETPAASALYPSTATLAEASARETADTQAMQDEVGFSAAIGADAPAVRDFATLVNQEFSRQLFTELATKFGLAPAASAANSARAANSASAANPATRGASHVALASYVGGVGSSGTRNASDLQAPDLRSQATGWVAFGGLLIPKSDQPLTGTHDDTTTKTGTAGSSAVEQTETVHLEVNLGQGLTELLVNMQSSTKTTRDGAITAIINGTGSTKVSINSCPDASGHVTGTVEIKVSELNSTGGATSTSDLTITASFTLTVDAGAHLSGFQIDATTAGGGIGGGSSWTAGGTTSFGGTKAPTSTSNGATDAQVKRVTDGAFYAFWAVSAITVEAEKFWRSGKCVDMNSSVESKTVAPKEKVKFSVEPRGAFDKQPIDAGVDVTFDGKESLDHAGGGHNPPVSLTYTAGEKKDDKGTVSLKQTSNRGIGTKSITFTVGDQDYKVNYAGGYVYNGTKCKGLAGPWTLQLSVGGGSGTVTFTIPENLGPAVATTNYKLNIVGTSSTYNLRGTITPVVDADGNASLTFKLGSGTITTIANGRKGTLPFADPTTDVIPLETGSFCGT